PDVAALTVDGQMQQPAATKDDGAAVVYPGIEPRSHHVVRADRVTGCGEHTFDVGRHRVEPLLLTVDPECHGLVDLGPGNCRTDDTCEHGRVQTVLHAATHKQAPIGSSALARSPRSMVTRP